MTRLSVVMLTFASVAGAAPPEVKLLYPAGGQRGTKVEVTCQGEFPWPVQVFAPGLDVVTTETAGSLEVTIPPDLAADRVWFRFYNQEGASDLVPFLIGNLPEVTATEPNNSPAQAQAVPARTTINGRLEVMEDVDCYSVQLTAGQTLVAAVDAHLRLGSPMDAILQIVSPDGFILAENHDDVGFDPLATLRVPKTGVYIVRLASFSANKATNIRFFGNKEMVYRLTVTDGPYVRNAMPAAISPHDTPLIGALGWNLPPAVALAIHRTGTRKLAELEEFEASAQIRMPPESHVATMFAPDVAGNGRVRVTPHTVVNHMDRADTTEPYPLTLPVAVTGRLNTPHQIDAYDLSLNKGDAVVITIESNRIDSLLDPLVTITDPAGVPIPSAAHAAVPQHDCMITFTATANGHHRLTVRDPYRMDSDRRYYRLSAWHDEADFDGSVDTNRIVLAAGKSLELPIKINRHGRPDKPIGPITLRALGLPEGLTAAEVVSAPSGDTATSVKLVLVSSGPPFSGPIRVQGTADTPCRIERHVRTPERLGAAFETIWTTVTP